MRIKVRVYVRVNARIKVMVKVQVRVGVEVRVEVRNNTVVTHNSDNPNSDISQNSDTLFALMNMSLFWEEEDFAKKID